MHAVHLRAHWGSSWEPFVALEGIDSHICTRGTCTCVRACMYICMCVHTYMHANVSKR